jgi:hypothetical protein
VVGFGLIFRLSAYRFEFRVAGSVWFPPGKAGNVLRGALGTVLRGSVFEPRLVDGPSGHADPPRPFVLRAAHLDGRRFERGETFSLDVHVFDLRRPLLEYFERAFAELAHTGLGPGRGGVELIQPAASADISLALNCETKPIRRLTVMFATPTELKGNPVNHGIPFGVLFARVRDRIGTLRNLYGEGPLPVDFKAQTDRAALVRTVNCDLRYRDISRLSSRTGDVHGIGGVTGTAQYEGDLAEFVPYLRAAWWTGVGRHTVWGNGVIEPGPAE